MSRRQTGIDCKLPSCQQLRINHTIAKRNRESRRATMKQANTQKSRRIAIALAGFALGAATLGSLANAAGPTPADAITARHAGFKKMGGAMKALGEQLKADAPAKPIMADAAATIQKTAQEQGKLFPAGSGPAPGVKTDALPAIWADKAKFDAQMAALVTESGKLVGAVNGGDTLAIRAQMKAVGGTCGSCHRQFRAEHN